MVDGVLVEGFIDLLIDTPDGLVVVDYKTDQVPSDAELDAAVGALLRAGRGVRRRAGDRAGPPGGALRLRVRRAPATPSSATVADLPAAAAARRPGAAAGLRRARLV